MASLAIQRERSEEALITSKAGLQGITSTLGKGVYVLSTNGPAAQVPVLSKYRAVTATREDRTKFMKLLKKSE